MMLHQANLKDRMAASNLVVWVNHVHASSEPRHGVHDTQLVKGMPLYQALVSTMPTELPEKASHSQQQLFLHL